MFAMLEHSIHRRFVGEYIPSRDFDPLDIVSLHKEASRMLTFVGLSGYHPLVENASLNNAAGDVHLNNNPADTVLHIRLSKSITGNPDKILCVLAHEICHKLLQYYHFPFLSGIQNECYTDVATFYVGFGKLTLNGAKEVIIDRKKILTNTIGYLSDETLSLAYQIVQRRYCLNDIGLTSQGRDLSYASHFSVERNVVLSRLNKCDKLRNNQTCDYEYFFVLKCPHCGKQSSKYYPHLYQKKIICKNCHKEFFMDAKYVFGEHTILTYASEQVKKIIQEIKRRIGHKSKLSRFE